MPGKTCPVVVVHCIDFRLQKPVSDWLQRRFGLSDFDRVAVAGGVQDVETVLKQVGVSWRLHAVRKAVLINHEDCGAYGEAGTYERLTADLREAGRRLRSAYPDLETELYLMHLTGILEPVPPA